MTTQREGVQALEASGALDDLYAKIDAGEVRLEGKDGLIQQLIKAGLERGLRAELTEHVGYEEGDPEASLYPSSRNGSFLKTVATSVGDVDLAIPRDRDGSFTPVLVPKGSRRVGGLDDMIVSLYAGGMTTRKPSLPLPVPVPPLVPANKLNGLERARILDVVNSPDYVDLPPIQIYARLLDRGVYLASISTIYRVLAENKQVKERRRLARHSARAIPELAVEMMKEIFGIHGTPHVVHADRGTSMTSKTVAALLSDLEVTKSHSRSHVSNDNPFSEAWFKTLKLAPVFPERFRSVGEAWTFMADFVDGYNHTHRHTGIGLNTPADVHYGLAAGKAIERSATLAAARAQNRNGSARPGTRKSSPCTTLSGSTNPSTRKTVNTR